MIITANFTATFPNNTNTTKISNKLMDIIEKMGGSDVVVNVTPAKEEKPIKNKSKGSVEKTSVWKALSTILLEKLGVGKEEIVREASIHSDLGADSLDFIEIIMEIEKEFCLSIPDDDAESLTMVGEMHDYIIKRRKL